MSRPNRKAKLLERPRWEQKVSFPSSLPISLRREEIATAIKEHQVIILAGETGSGKTTQLPKICLSLGYGEKGLIAHTQPRRIAARTVADRIASELNTPLGDGVGYQVRFTDKSNENTRIKLMTDGVLLAEFQRDRQLKKYDVIIIDEAHERSLNIDFLLGLLKPLCKKRPELKVIVTSATIDLEKFSKHFTIRGKPAPIIEVSGRTYPVETLYTPADSLDKRLPDQICDAVANIVRGEAKGQFKASGDILVFCAGEREIRDCAQALRKSKLEITILPLYSRLSISEQNKVFQTAHRRKVVLATNVAETSITVPGIAYVIDPGNARISRYSFRSKIQRLPIEGISKASANQRKGRCGRVANGVCIRLYSEQEYDQRDDYTPAEILRSNLAAVILKMRRLGIKNIEQFDFIDKPDRRLVNDGFKLLQELGAIDKQGQLSKIGRQMSDLSVDPKLARILIEANSRECLGDALVVVSALSIQDPRERPAEHQAAADQSHRLLHDKHSDFTAYLNLWQSIISTRSELSNSRFKDYCAKNFLSIARVFEWRELHRQLLTQCKSMNWTVKKWTNIELNLSGSNKSQKNSSFSKRYQVLHQALLSGLLSNIAAKDIDGEYLATRGRRVHLFPASSQAKRLPKWVLAAEFLETSKTFAHTIAELKPEWIIEASKHLCKYSYSSPHYHVRSGQIKAYRKTLLYGLELKTKEAVNFSAINPGEARDLFIQQALVEGAYKPRALKGSFVEHNQTLIKDIEKLETKTRKRNLLIDDSKMSSFYHERLPQNILNRQALEHWLAAGNQNILKLNRDQILSEQFDAEQAAQFPDKLTVAGKEVLISYLFDPSSQADGVTMHIPISVLAPFPMHIGDWLVPGLLKEKCVALIKTLPKPIRRHYTPASITIDRIFQNLTLSEKPLASVLAKELYKTRGIEVKEENFDSNKLDAFYLMNYRIIDVDGSLIEESHDLNRLKQDYANAVQKSIHSNHSPERKRLEHHNIETWTFPNLIECQEYRHEGMTIQAYPMLKVRSDNSLSYLLHDQQVSANYHSHYGLIALAKKILSESMHSQSLKYLRKEILKPTRPKKADLSSLAQQLSSFTPSNQDQNQWREALIDAGLLAACFNGVTQDFLTQEKFQAALDKGAKNWVSITMEFEAQLVKALAHRDRLQTRINTLNVESIELDLQLEQIKSQLYRLFDTSILSFTDLETLRQYPRYLKAIDSRIDKLYSNAAALTAEAELSELQTKLDARLDEITTPNFGIDFAFLTQPALYEFSMMLEEWRVSIYAQQLRARIKVSEKRLRKFWDEHLEN